VCGLLVLGVLGVLLTATDKLLTGRVVEGVLRLVVAAGFGLLAVASFRAR
jgi:predicted nucleic acid-binding protein